MGKEQVVLEDDADRTRLRRRTVQLGPVEPEMTVGERDETGEGAQRGRLAGAVGAEEGDHVTGRSRQRHIEAEGTALDHQTGGKSVGGPAGRADGVLRGLTGVGHAALIQRSRSPASTAIDTASRTRLRAIAASGSFCRAR